ncbi:hypothetical protein SDJN03_14530, partial [Cucurbita argyrosperma subsp. sororia]
MILQSLTNERIMTNLRILGRICLEFRILWLGDPEQSFWQQSLIEGKHPIIHIRLPQHWVMGILALE